MRIGKKHIFCLIMVLMLSIVGMTSFTSAAAESGQTDESPLISTESYIQNAKAGILYEATTGTVIYEKNADMELPPASMTKVMTAILVLEANPDLEGKLTVDKRAVSSLYCGYMEPQHHLLADEIISYKECMKYLLVPSGNEAATAFAFTLTDDMHDFLDMMNAKAKELGCENTNFQDCIGLSSDKHYTTPRDMVKMCEYAMSFEQFRNAVSYENGTIPASNVRDEGFDYETTNRVKFPDDRYESPYSQYVTGVKTGWIPASGYCFSGCLEKDGLVYYSVIMGGEELPYKDGKRIVQGDFVDTIELYSLTDNLEAIGPATGPEDNTVTSLLGAGSFNVAVSEDAKLLVKKGTEVTAEYNIPSIIFGTVKKGDAIGTVTLKAGDRAQTFDLQAVSDRNLSPFMLVLGVIILAAIIILVYRIRKHS